ncbi:MAG TPA: amino acid adenylation domain-containing protein [Candidatus Binatia bacterium]
MTDTGAQRVRPHRETPHGCFHHLFAAQAERAPEAVAVAYKNELLTYRELNRRANQLAHYLSTLGIGPGALVGICMERAPAMMVGLLGILKAGAGYLPLDPSYPSERLAFMIQDAQAPVVLTQKRVRGKLSTVTANVVCLDEDWPAIAQLSDEDPDVEVGLDHLAYLIYTSGSTGRPKGVMIHHRGLVNYLCWASDFYRLSEGQGTLVHSPLGFDLTITTLFAPLLCGQRVVLLPEGLGVEELAGALKAGTDFSAIKITPTHLEALAHLLPPEQLAGRVRVAVIGGEMLRWEHIAAWRAHAPAMRLINEYGPTETVVGCCVYEVTDDAVTSGSVPIGRAIANMEMHLLGADLQPVAAGEIGELHLSGVGLARGYLNQPETTQAKFIYRADGTRLYKTGDLARALPDGNLEYLGRTDHQVKVRGFRIELGEIEVALSQHSAVRDCVVVAREEASGDRRLVAYVVGADPTTAAISELQNFLQQRLPGYMAPSAFVVLDGLPLTVNGKVDRDALPDPAEHRPTREPSSFKAPSDSLEKQLTEVWEEILGIRPIGVSENFFELGGDSLQAVLIAAKIEEIRGRHIPPSVLIEENTIEKLARAIHRLDIEPRDTTVVAVQPKGNLPPLFLAAGIGGLVLGQSYLARRLGNDQPLYGLQARGVRDSESPCASIKEMAAYYIEAVQAVQPRGPYYIGGYSFGGVVAFEMARQLDAKGEPVGILAIFDTVAPGVRGFSLVDFMRNLPYWLRDFVVRRTPAAVLARIFAEVKKISKTGVNMALSRLIAEPSIEPLKIDIAENVEMPSQLPERYRKLIEAHYNALLNYAPQKYAGRVTLFRTQAQPLFQAYADNGWRRLAMGGVDVYQVEGDHLNFLDEPYVQTLAKQIRLALEKNRQRMNQRPADRSNARDQIRDRSFHPIFSPPR